MKTYLFTGFLLFSSLSFATESTSSASTRENFRFGQAVREFLGVNELNLKDEIECLESDLYTILTPIVNGSRQTLRSLWLGWNLEKTAEEYCIPETVKIQIEVINGKEKRVLRCHLRADNNSSLFGF
ncbi:MAG: hypothetical protein KDD34_00820 [Bdellovibrionales bacterium]|nr:hypothetical protein [Bdellovibrionales bacterium]